MLYQLSSFGKECKLQGERVTRLFLHSDPGANKVSRHCNTTSFNGFYSLLLRVMKWESHNEKIFRIPFSLCNMKHRLNGLCLSLRMIEFFEKSPIFNIKPLVLPHVSLV